MKQLAPPPQLLFVVRLGDVTFSLHLRGRDPAPHYLDALPSPARLEADLVEKAMELTRCQVRGGWEGRTPERCLALGCGYVYRCHPEDGGV